MFKWTCFAVGVIFLGVIAWMVNDIRVQVGRSAQTVQETGKTVNQNLPALLEKTQKSTDLVSEQLPQIMERIRVVTETLAELAADLRQLKELAGMSSTVRDQGLVAYAESVIKLIEDSGGTIGLKKMLGGSGLKNTVPAKEWTVGARKEALLLTVIVKSKKEMATRLSKNKFGSPWYIQFGDKEPVMLLDWLKENHPGSKDL